LILDLKQITTDEFHESTDYTNPEANPLIFCGETNVFLVNGEVYNTYAPNIFWYKDNGSYDNPVGRLIYVIQETGVYIRIYFDVDDKPFKTKEDLRNIKLSELLL
jgi:hypothetical protein